ncbi:hypothetical protein Y027_4906 [Burkholderia pseudomallei TSV5]|nr:hypothetical protein Y027_4906 [Burkholderia pseudomallei TSV5]
MHATWRRTAPLRPARRSAARPAAPSARARHSVRRPTAAARTGRRCGLPVPPSPYPRAPEAPLRALTCRRSDCFPAPRRRAVSMRRRPSSTDRMRAGPSHSRSAARSRKPRTGCESRRPNARTPCTTHRRASESRPRSDASPVAHRESVQYRTGPPSLSEMSAEAQWIPSRSTHRRSRDGIACNPAYRLSFLTLLNLKVIRSTRRAPHAAIHG